MFIFLSSRRRHTIYIGDWSSDVCSSDLDCLRPSVSPSSGSPSGAFHRYQGNHPKEIDLMAKLKVAGNLACAFLISPNGRRYEIGRASCGARQCVGMRDVEVVIYDLLTAG